MQGHSPRRSRVLDVSVPSARFSLCASQRCIGTTHTPLLMPPHHYHTPLTMAMARCDLCTARRCSEPRSTTHGRQLNRPTLPLVVTEPPPFESTNGNISSSSRTASPRLTDSTSGFNRIVYTPL
jgi:hypothetical protein